LSGKRDVNIDESLCHLGERTTKTGERTHYFGESILSSAEAAAICIEAVLKKVRDCAR